MDILLPFILSIISVSGIGFKLREAIVLELTTTKSDPKLQVIMNTLEDRYTEFVYLMSSEAAYIKSIHIKGVVFLLLPTFLRTREVFALSDPDGNPILFAFHNSHLIENGDYYFYHNNDKWMKVPSYVYFQIYGIHRREYKWTALTETSYIRKHPLLTHPYLVEKYITPKFIRYMFNPSGKTFFDAAQHGLLRYKKITHMYVDKVNYINIEALFVNPNKTEFTYTECPVMGYRPATLVELISLIPIKSIVDGM